MQCTYECGDYHYVESDTAFTIVSPHATDFDQDGDVDLTDFQYFHVRFNGPNRPATLPPCSDADFDKDDDVDLADFTLFLNCFNGPERPPACE